MGKTWHPDCISCTVCQTSVKGGMYQRKGYEWPVCLDHAKCVTEEQEGKLISRQRQWEEILKVSQSRHE